jgi:hypothetical protein
MPKQTEQPKQEFTDLQKKIINKMQKREQRKQIKKGEMKHA